MYFSTRGDERLTASQAIIKGLASDGGLFIFDKLPDIRYNEKFSKYCETYNCQAPWFCVYPFTEVDIELSKRIFVAKCGHLFCGRCVKNIGNRPKLRKSKTSNANSSTAEISILNPKFYAPSTCPELQCQKKFLSKSFTEFYF